MGRLLGAGGLHKLEFLGVFLGVGFFFCLFCHTGEGFFHRQICKGGEGETSIFKTLPDNGPAFRALLL